MMYAVMLSYNKSHLFVNYCRVDSSKKTADGQYVRYVQMDYKQSIWNYRQESNVSYISD